MKIEYNRIKDMNVFFNIIVFDEFYDYDVYLYKFYIKKRFIIKMMFIK